MSEADVDAVAENVTSLLMDDKLGRGNKPITGAAAAAGAIARATSIPGAPAFLRGGTSLDARRRGPRCPETPRSAAGGAATELADALEADGARAAAMTCYVCTRWCGELDGAEALSRG